MNHESRDLERELLFAMFTVYRRYFCALVDSGGVHPSEVVEPSWSEVRYTVDSTRQKATDVGMLLPPGDMVNAFVHHQLYGEEIVSEAPWERCYV